MTSFQCFDPALLKFLTDLKLNNNRDWFHENKVTYGQDVVEPMQDFITAMGPPLKKISKHLVADPRRQGGSLFRIHRDVRFGKDKRPYKEHVACKFQHSAAKDVHTPGFYVHIEPDKVIFGGGIWLPDSESLYQIRDRIRSKPKEWQRVVEDKALVKLFGGVSGDGLVRPPRGFDADTPFIEDIKRKSFFAMRHESVSIALSKQWMEEVVLTFTTATPLIRFICKALALPF